MENINMSQIATRSNHFDNIKGLLIILVVLGHLMEQFLNLGLVKYFYIVIFSFHMPLFIFCSGYFATNINFKKIITRLIFPYIVFQILYLFFNTFVLGDTGISYTFTDPCWTLWYLLSFIFWGVMVNFIEKVDLKVILIAFAVGLLVGFDNSVGYYLSLSRTIVFFPFFLLGYYCKKNEVDFLKFNKNKLLVTVISLLSIMVIFGLYIYSSSINVAWLYGFSSYKTLDYNLIIRLIIYLAALILSAMIIIIVPNFKIKKITNIGVNSMVIYLLHGFIIRYLEKVFDYEILSSGMKVLSYLIVTTLVIVLVLSSKYITIPLQKLLKR
ncbi:MAG: acyltransferase family protein [Candidatus Shapirobacteria bacterium]|nr:acyltransferase family protein [Candidatus Shapirobacteria bacterium]MDD4383202.1 acyltransferase family protein [Candidatus Shapirobacteria bacterium]